MIFSTKYLQVCGKLKGAGAQFVIYSLAPGSYLISAPRLRLYNTGANNVFVCFFYKFLFFPIHPRAPSTLWRTIRSVSRQTRVTPAPRPTALTWAAWWTRPSSTWTLMTPRRWCWWRTLPPTGAPPGTGMSSSTWSATGNFLSYVLSQGAEPPPPLTLSVAKTGRNNFRIFFMSVLYSTLLHLPPLRFHCVVGSWDRTQDSCDFGIGCQTL